MSGQKMHPALGARGNKSGKSRENVTNSASRLLSLTLRRQQSCTVTGFNCATAEKGKKGRVITQQKEEIMGYLPNIERRREGRGAAVV